MPKKKPVSQDATIFTKAQPVAITESTEVAPDAETAHGTEETIPEPETPEFEPIEGTRALPIRTPDSKVATGNLPTTDETKPLPVVAAEPVNPISPEKQIPEDSTQAIPKRVDTGPLAPVTTPASRYKTVAQNIEPRPAPAPLPAWIWALVGGAGALVLAGGLFILRQRLATPAANTQDTPASERPTTAAPEAGVPEEDVPIALRSYLEKAKAGDDRAMVMLGVMYTQGLNVSKDPKKGRQWYDKAAEKHNKVAEKWLKENPAN